MVKFILFIELWFGALRAGMLEKMDFPDQLSVAGSALVLNGMGLRSKRIIVRFKGYVAALYVREKARTAAAVLGEKGPKVVELAFLRSLGKSTLVEAWEEGLKKNCETCPADKVRALSALMRDVREGQRLRLVFTDNAVLIEMHGAEEANGRIEGEEFATGLLRVFIGDHPPTEELKTGLLGG